MAASSNLDRKVEMMQLQHLVDGLATYPSANRLSNVAIQDIADDSRHTRPGCLFIARSPNPSHTLAAVKRGAIAIVVTPEVKRQIFSALPKNVVCCTASTITQLLAGTIAERFFGYPSQKLKLIGITGTNGKTTTAFIAQHLLQSTGLSCGMIGTVWIDVGKNLQASLLTTPGAIEISRLLAKMVDHGCRAAVIETSSHGLHQGRTAAIDFNTSVFTNLTGDHLDYHKSLDDYAAAKSLLFKQLNKNGWAVINRDDPHSSQIVDGCKAKIIWCHVIDKPTKSPRDDVCTATILDLTSNHSRARFDGPWGSAELKLPLIGQHNIANALQAIAAVHTISSMTETLQRGLNNCPTVPGRLEPISVGQSPQPTVLVDYAHTHDALENVLRALGPLTQGRLIVVFGCGGNRDRTKRPKMAAIACRFADQVIVTSDNPRAEEPMQIIDNILQGVPGAAQSKIIVEPDRASAITVAIAEATDHDTVLLAGKGHEDYQIIGTRKHHFDDREHAAKSLRKYLRQA